MREKTRLLRQNRRIARRASRSVYSLRSIMTLNLCLVAALCLLMVLLMVTRVMDLTEKNRFQTALRTYTEQLDKQISQEFTSLINISQQMLPSGNIGAMVESYLYAESPYEMIEDRKWIDSLIGQSVFSANQVELAAYCNADSSLWIGSMRVKESFQPTTDPVLSQTPSITFQGLHNSANRFTNTQVFSIMRPVLFSDDIPRYIYIESRTDIASSLKALEEEQGIPYRLIQLDRGNVVRYSLADNIAVGDPFDLSGRLTQTAGMTIGRGQGYVWCYAPERFGFKNVLLLPESYYDYERMTLYRDIVFFSLAAVLMILLLSIVFRNQLYRPLKTIQEEMQLMGGGDMAIREHSFSIREYKILFEQFVSMKRQITCLMDDIGRTEREKQKLELDKLYFQMNPHFLINALNSAQWQARLEDQPALADYLSHLNYILAYTLGKVNRNTTLRSEIRMLTEYLELQQTRQDFKVHTRVEPGLYLDVPCARLILQPVAENAVCHSLNDFGNLWIDIGLRERDKVCIQIRDDGVGFDTALLSYKNPSPLSGERQAKNGIGLRYVWLTLREFYGGDAQMEVDSHPGGGTCVTILLPANPGGPDGKTSG